MDIKLLLFLIAGAGIAYYWIPISTKVMQWYNAIKIADKVVVKADTLKQKIEKTKNWFKNLTRRKQ